MGVNVKGGAGLRMAEAGVRIGSTWIVRWKRIFLPSGAYPSEIVSRQEPLPRFSREDILFTVLVSDLKRQNFAMIEYII